MGARGVKGEQRERTGGWKSERRDERADTRVVRLPPASLFSPLLAQVLKRTWLVCGRLTTSVGAVGGAPANGSNCEAAAGWRRSGEKRRRRMADQFEVCRARSEGKFKKKIPEIMPDFASKEAQKPD